ncbi:MAG: SRPBCC family protein [Bacteroidetes bacterium]|nr:SRPBCC family protein [Bacteroidota bacterium]
MKALKFIGVLFLLLLVVLLTLPLIMPNHAETSSSIFVQTNAQTVFRQVNNLKNWSNWSPFVFDNPSMKSVYSGPEVGVGSSHSWKSEDMGDGSMTILANKPYENIQILLDMKEGGLAIDEWSFEEKEGGVEVTWTLKLSDLKYPFHRYFGFFIESMMKPMQEKGLEKLKEISEVAPQSISIELIELQAEASITVLDSAMIKDLKTISENNYAELQLFIKRARVQPTGPAFAMYYNWDVDKPVLMRVGFPISEEVKESGRVVFFTRPGGKALKGVYVGPYEASAIAHYDIDAHMLDFGYVQSKKPIWEEYIVGPLDEADPNKWVTHIFYYLDEVTEEEAPEEDENQ